MRRCLCTLLMSCVLGFATLTAAELTTAQAQVLVNAVQSATPGGPEVDATLTIDGKSVAFKVKRDAVGNAVARPVPGPDSKDIDIAQVSIHFVVVPSGLLNPTGLVLITNSQAVISYAVQLTPDGTIASLYVPGTQVGGPGKGGAKPVVGGIGATSAAIIAQGGKPFPPSYFVRHNWVLVYQLPAGTRTSDPVSRSQP